MKVKIKKKRFYGGREMKNFLFEMITGPMSCGKTEELLRRVKRSIIAKKRVKIFSPIVDTRVKGDYIESRNGLAQDAVKIALSTDILRYVTNGDQIIAIDEIQFFDKDIVEVVKKLISSGKKVIAAGLDLDFKAQPFGNMPELLCLADRVDKLTAICMKCGSEYANRTQRLINGEPADLNSPLIMIGGDETYEARCIDCYELPDKKSTAFKRFKLLSGGLKKENNNITEESLT